MEKLRDDEMRENSELLMTYIYFPVKSPQLELYDAHLFRVG